MNQYRGVVVVLVGRDRASRDASKYKKGAKKPPVRTLCNLCYDHS